MGARALLVADHPGSGPAPFVALAAAAAVTSTLRLGSYVLNAGVHEPLLVARDVATLDVVSDGRAELGIGAGHNPAEWLMTGRTRPEPAARVERMIAVTEAVRTLLAGGTVPVEQSAGALGDLTLARPRPVQERVPVLVGGGNPTLLRWAGAHADAVGITGLGRTLADGHGHTVNWRVADLDRQVARIREGARDAGVPVPPLEALVQHVEAGTDRRAAAAEQAAELDTPVDDLLQVPYMLFGPPAQIAEQMLAARERWGICRWVLRPAAIDVAEQLIRALAA